MACIDACSALDTSAAAAGATDAGAAPLDERCPEPPFPCERLCWELETRGSEASSNADRASLGEPAIRCALARARDCRAAAALTDPAVTDPAVTSVTRPASEEPVSWTRLFLECAGLPADLDVFD